MWDLSPLTRDPACVPLHWKADFKPLDHQGSLKIIIIIFFGYGPLLKSSLYCFCFMFWFFGFEGS